MLATTPAHALSHLRNAPTQSECPCCCAVLWYAGAVPALKLQKPGLTIHKEHYINARFSCHPLLQGGCHQRTPSRAWQAVSCVLLVQDQLHTPGCTH